MKLLFSAASPYVRKISVLAIEAGLEGRIEKVTTAATPTQRNPDLVSKNPLGKVPCLITDEGMALYDSRVIAEYLDSLNTGAKFFPAGGPARWEALMLQALGDGLLDAALLTRYETFLRPEQFRWPDWVNGQIAKITGALDDIESKVPGFGSRVDIGTVSVACSLGYLDLRFAHLNWRDGRPKAAAWAATIFERPSFKQTVPVA